MGGSGIRANAICPGPIETPLLRHLWTSEAERDKRLNRIPLGRFGAPEDIVNAGIFLASRRVGLDDGHDVHGRRRRDGELFLSA